MGSRRTGSVEIFRTAKIANRPTGTLCPKGWDQPHRVPRLHLNHQSRKRLVRLTFLSITAERKIEPAFVEMQLVALLAVSAVIYSMVQIQRQPCSQGH